GSRYVSARNLDLTIPQVEVTNMPATATFNPETKHFFWIEDEEAPAPMTYKAIRGEQFVTTEGELISGQFAVDAEEEFLPNGFELSQNYPNPFNPSTVIRYQLPVSSKVQLKVFDALGRQVAELVNGNVSSGIHTVQFNATS